MLNKSLTIITGPMYSGKTSLLFEIYNYNVSNNKSQLVIDHTFIKDQLLQIHNLYNHDKKYLSCIKLNSRLLKNYKYNNYNIIHINEAQFYPNLKEIILYILDNYNIHIYCYGLDSDYKKEKFGEIIDLIPHCDNIIKLSGVKKNHIIMDLACSTGYTSAVLSKLSKKVYGIDNKEDFLEVKFLNSLKACNSIHLTHSADIPCRNSQKLYFPLHQKVVLLHN